MIIRVLFIIILAITFSCEEAGRWFYCDECLAEEPINATLEFKLSEEYFTNPVEIYVYEGDIEDDILLAYFDYAKTAYEVAINKKYTILAKYRIGETYICVNSTTPRVTYYPNLCDEPCYYVSGRVLDLRLKYR